ncbi:enoyl-CoA hydratase/isomerase family protein [Mycobacterium talmoniae]|uniref:Enoyl-CoA hydratase n=1 Tax=Mycobacterium talmoniae TaxID=1858794 RepID=A0A1S1NMZ5_9MYCO|nr:MULTISPECIES: enoyl-CoA hydratase-related protein [Mycobacterium]OHV05431.1 enoyl-CoA hydratase [Mycobacterium talmoniae]PQM45387.1 Short-chain-enoyl-CoA hydratase [Mycobacterium talmoniae]TDH49352.1 enoyl-CoA hydratase [Mycobacterium eburneum]
MTATTVLINDNGAVRTITLSRPEKRNAIDLELRVALAQAIEAAGSDQEIHAIVITGAGPAFCSGGDITTMERMPVDRAIERAELAQRVIRAIWSTPKPVLAAVEGSAFGAGTALAAACDRVVAARDAKFATTFTNVGLAGDMGTFVSLPARVGMARARQMLLFPRSLSAAEALEFGLVDAVVEPGESLDSACRDAERLADGPAAAYGVIKTLLSESGTANPFDMLQREAACQSKLFDTDDFAEGVAAFRDKRPPLFGSKRGARL